MKNNVFSLAFFLSVLAHVFILAGLPGISLDTKQVNDQFEIELQIKIEEQQLIPRIDQIGPDKKIEQVELLESPEEAFQPVVDIVKESLLEKKEVPAESIKGEEVVSPEMELDTVLPKVSPGSHQKFDQIVSEEEKKPLEIKRKQSSEPIMEESFNPLVQKKEIMINSEPSPLENDQKVEVVLTQQDEESMYRYQDMIRQRIQSASQYPRWARRQGIEGFADVRFIVFANGKIAAVEVMKYSGSQSFEKEALAAIHSIRQFPPIPVDNVPQTQIDIRIIFNLD